MFRLTFMLVALFAFGAGTEVLADPLSHAPIAKTVKAESRSIQWNSDLAMGRASMVKSQQPMILFLTAPSCQYCELMKQTTFSQQWIIGEINKKFTPVMINGRENKRVTEKLRVRMFPATAFVHPNGRVVEIAHGYKSPTQFAKYLAAAQSKLQVQQKKLAKKVSAKNSVK